MRDYHQDRHVFRHHLQPETNEGLNVGHPNRRFAEGRFREVFADDLTLSNDLVVSGDAQIASLGVGVAASGVAGRLTVNENLIVSGTGPHAFGGATDSTAQLRLRGTFAERSGLVVNPVLQPGIGVSAAHAIISGGTIQEAASGTHPDFIGLHVQQPTITGAGASLTNATTLKIDNAPTSDGTDRALWVDAGPTALDGSVTIGGTLIITDTGPGTFGATATTAADQFRFTGTFAPADANPAGLVVATTLTPNAGGGVVAGVNLIPTITRPAATTVSRGATLELSPPTFTGSGSVTDAVSFYVGSAPSVGTNNYAVWVDSGTSRFDGNIDLSAQAGSQIIIGTTDLNFLEDTGTTGLFRIADGGTVFVGNENANVNMAVGVTIQQDINDNQAFALKSSTDVTTGLTTAHIAPFNTETDDYFVIGKVVGTTGGAHLLGLGETGLAASILIEGYAGAPATTDTTASDGAIYLRAGQHDGANALVDMAANSNLLAIAEVGIAGAQSTKFILKADDGALHIGGEIQSLGGSGEGPFAFGGATAANAQMVITGIYSGATGLGRAFEVNSTINAVANNDAATVLVNGTLAEAGSGTHTTFSSLRVAAPSITAGAATLDNAATIYVVGPPSGATNNYALWVDSGNTRLDGDLTVAGDLSVTGDFGMRRSYLAGLGLANNATDADHDIDISPGETQDENDRDTSMILSSTLVKQIDAAWAVGTNQGGLDTGTVAADTWYHVHIIERSDTGVTDALFSTSATAPTMPTSYDKRRRVGAVLTDSVANIIAFSQVGDEFLWLDPPLDVDATNPGTAAVTRTLSVPTGIQVRAIVNVIADQQTSGGGGAYISSLDVNDEAPSRTAAPLGLIQVVARAEHESAQNVTVRTNTSAQIRSRLNTSSTNDAIRIATIGWHDRHGRDD